MRAPCGIVLHAGIFEWCLTGVDRPARRVRGLGRAECPFRCVHVSHRHLPQQGQAGPAGRHFHTARRGRHGFAPGGGRGAELDLSQQLETGELPAAQLGDQLLAILLAGRLFLRRQRVLGGR